MLALIFVALVLAVIVARRALPILCGGLVASLVWGSSRDAVAFAVSGLTGYLVASWLLDAAASHDWTRRISVGAEMLAAATALGVIALEVVDHDSAGSFWIVSGCALAAMAMVARWRDVVF